MFIFFVISMVIADRVKIASKDSPSYILTLIGNEKGGSIRMMKESDVDNPSEQSGFELNGDKTELANNGVVICGNIWGSGIATCLRKSSKKTVFNVIKTEDDVTFKTDDGKCLTMADYDSDTRGYFLRLKDCSNKPNQKFKIVDLAKPDQTKTPLAPFPNETNGSNSSNNSNSQNTLFGNCSNVDVSNIGFKPVSCYSNISLITDGPPFNDYIKGLTGVCSNTNQSRRPTSFTSVYKFRRPAQSVNGCDPHQQWPGTFRQYY
jgi:hypothetical protein